MSHLVSYTGKILFDPENKTKKHESQATWKKVAMVIFDDELYKYYAWFINRRFNLPLDQPLRGAHISFINDRVDDINNSIGTLEEKEAMWEALKQKWNGVEIEVTLNLNPYSNSIHWWLIVDHAHRDQLHAIRAEIGLGRPYFGLHMSIGRANPRTIAHSEYINLLHEKGYIELNPKYEQIQSTEHNEESDEV